MKSSSAGCKTWGTWLDRDKKTDKMARPLNILTLSNFYPPSHSWGYTQLCHEVNQGLIDRGHTVTILTSRDGTQPDIPYDSQIVRSLHLESDPQYYRPRAFFQGHRRQLQYNLTSLTSLIQRQQPDIIFVWGMWNLSHQLPAIAERLLPDRVVYYLSDHWPVLPNPHWKYWQQPARHWYLRPLKELLNRLARRRLKQGGDPPQLRFQHPICVSQALRDSLVAQGAPVEHATVIYNGIDTRHFTPRQAIMLDGSSANHPLKLLVAGRLERNKGIHTAIEAVGLVVDQFPTRSLQLTIVGAGRPEYEAELHTMVRQRGLNRWVTFRPRVSRQEMPEVLQEHEVLIFPSTVIEALPRMPQEAMACGLAVIGTTTGGTAELLIDGQTGLTFTPGNPQELASQIIRLLNEPRLRLRLAASGRRAVLEQFNLEHMILQIERYLTQVATQA